MFSNPDLSHVVDTVARGAVGVAASAGSPYLVAASLDAGAVSHAVQLISQILIAAATLYSILRKSKKSETEIR